VIERKPDVNFNALLAIAEENLLRAGFTIAFDSNRYRHLPELVGSLAFAVIQETLLRQR